MTEIRVERQVGRSGPGHAEPCSHGTESESILRAIGNQ